MLIPDLYLERLQDQGLLVSEPFVANHRQFPEGVTIGKPEAVVGNFIPGLRTMWGWEDPVEVDAPLVYLHVSDAGKWVVTVHEYIPGPGPGDFVHEHSTPEEAIKDIFDFFFGDPARMEVKRMAREKVDLR